MAINRVILIGRMTKDLETRMTSTGKQVGTFTLAVNRQGKQEEADFIRCVAWNKTAELMAKYTHKGSLIGIEGRIQTGSYTDRDGKQVYTTDIVCDSVQFLEPKQQQAVKPTAEEPPAFNPMGRYENPFSQHEEESPGLELDDEDLPF